MTQLRVAPIMPDCARRVTFDFPPVDKERAFDILDVMAPIAEAHGVSVARIALAWRIALRIGKSLAMN